MSSFPSARTRENPSSSESIISPLSILYIKINKRTLGNSLQLYASNGPNIFVVAEKISFVMKTRAKPTHVISCCLNACSMLTGEINNYWTISALSNMHGNKKIPHKKSFPTQNSRWKIAWNSPQAKCFKSGQKRRLLGHFERKN